MATIQVAVAAHSGALQFTTPPVLLDRVLSALGRSSPRPQALWRTHKAMAKRG